MNSSAMRLFAGSRWRHSMTVCRDYCVRMCWAGNQAGSTRSSISMEEAVTAACRWRQKEWATDAASPWRNLAKSSCAPRHGIPSHAPGARPALMKLISTSISRKRIHSKGNAAVAATTSAPGRFGGSRSSTDYAARPARGDPRGRKSGAGPGTENPT
jgi:hypothetical protein